MNLPQFEITNSMIAEIAEITELVGRITATRTPSPTVIRKNRFRAISSTLSISTTALKEEQVAAIIEGQDIAVSQETIQSVRNMFQLYRRLERMDPYLVSDLFAAHSIMMNGLLPDAGSFCPDQTQLLLGGEIRKMGGFSEGATNLITNLLHWVETDESHLLIKTCIFHYMFELHHLFSDGNGRMARIWHTLLLSKWRPLFSWIPIEPRLYANQKAYYSVSPKPGQAADAAAFISFMLQAIREALEDTDRSRNRKTGSKTISDTSSKMSSKYEKHWSKISQFLEKNDSVQNGDVQELCGVTSSTATRILKTFVEADRLERTGKRFHERYILKLTV